MTTANHSTNQQPHGLGNLGQIIAGQDQFKILTTAEIEALPEAEYLAYCAEAFAMPTTGRTLEEIEASATEILKELNGHNATEQNPCPWVLVEQAGTDDESIAEMKNKAAAPKIVKSTAKKTAVKKPINQELAV